MQHSALWCSLPALYIVGGVPRPAGRQTSSLPELQTCSPPVLKTSSLEDLLQTSTMSSSLLVGQVMGCLSVSVLLMLLFVKAVWHRREHPPQDGHGHGVLITGCDSGFGFELARRLDQQGFTVFAGCLWAEGPGACSLAQLCSSSLQLLQLDVTQDQDVAQSLRTVQEQLPHKGESRGE